MSLAGLTEHDRAALLEAAALIRDVQDRHPLRLNGPIITAAFATAAAFVMVVAYVRPRWSRASGNCEQIIAEVTARESGRDSA